MKGTGREEERGGGIGGEKGKKIERWEKGSIAAGVRKVIERLQQRHSGSVRRFTPRHYHTCYAANTCKCTPQRRYIWTIIGVVMHVYCEERVCLARSKGERERERERERRKKERY